MDNNDRRKMLRSVRFYLANAMKFYNVGSEALTPFIFIITFLLYTVSSIILDNVSNGTGLSDWTSSLTKAMDYDKFMVMFHDMVVFFTTSMAVSLVRDFLLAALTSVFLAACIKAVKGEAYSLKTCLQLVMHNIFRILAASFLFSLFYTFGLIAFVVPGAIFYFTFLFYLCYILDGKTGVMQAFTASRQRTTGHRIEILAIVIVFKLVTFVVLNFISSIVVAMLGASDNSLIQEVVPAFLMALVYLMDIKLIVLMYHDLVYGWESME